MSTFPIGFPDWRLGKSASHDAINAAVAAFERLVQAQNAAAVRLGYESRESCARIFRGAVKSSKAEQSRAETALQEITRSTRAEAKALDEAFIASKNRGLTYDFGSDSGSGYGMNTRD